MTTIEDQINLEKKMVAYGISRYRNTVQSAEDNDRSADSRYAQVLLREFVTPVADGISAYCDVKQPGFKAKYKVLLRQVDPMKAAYFGLRSLFNHFTQEASMQKLANSIGMMIEDELKFGKFHRKHGDYYEAIIDDFKRKGTKNYRHMHRVLTHKANEYELRWNAWTLEEKISVGIKVIDIILQETDLIEKKTVHSKGKSRVLISPTADSIDWMRDFHAHAELLNPDKLPCLIKPDEWTSIHEGGYYTPQMRKRSPMVKTRDPEHTKMFSGDISTITNTINTIQNTAWSVNGPVYDVLKQVWERSIPVGLPQSEPYVMPLSPVQGKKKSDFTDAEKELFDEWKAEARAVHTMERERVSKCFQAVRVLRLAAEYSNRDKFWFVYQCDFRGRIYAQCTGFSPQGPDFGKACIKFAEGKTLGERGLYWLRVHGANTFGQDKVPYDARVGWVIQNEKDILSSAENPLDATEFWGNADKPWQFLAFCFEYARFKKEGINMLTYLPIGLDGSCNGLQNFSAMLRDEVGAKATNLVPSETPTDIYSEVAKVCTENLEGSQEPFADLWRALAEHHGGYLPRGLAKRPVMTLPYGSTQQSCREYIYQYIVEDAPEFFPPEVRFKASLMLTPILWESISQVVVAARQAMDWIQLCASTIAKSNNPTIWWTPLGFPVMQSRKKIKVRQIKTELVGVYKISVGDETDVMDVSKNRLGSSPNFVHSMDACHLMMTCRLAEERGIQDFAFIHDDYGTHAGNIDTLHECIREAFLELYGQNDPLVDFKIFNEDHSQITLTDPPNRGSLNINQVLESKYFFG